MLNETQHHNFHAAEVSEEILCANCNDEGFVILNAGMEDERLVECEKCWRDYETHALNIKGE